MTSKSLRVVFNMLLGVAIGCTLAVVLLVYGDEIEGFAAPVVEPLTLEALVGVEGEGAITVWRGSSMKLRNCNHVRTEWFLGPRFGRKVQTKMLFRDPPEVRDKGPHVWHGIVIYLDEQQVALNSHADVIHKCPWRFWETRTRFYDSERN